jgi:NADPH:quinone reductase-like Zn-dependent oxidoreductase
VKVSSRGWVSQPDTTAKVTYAEFTAVNEELLSKKPSNLTFEEAASIPLPGLTAWQCLVDNTKVKQGDKVIKCSSTLELVA